MKKDKKTQSIRYLVIMLFLLWELTGCAEPQVQFVEQSQISSLTQDTAKEAWESVTDEAHQAQPPVVYVHVCGAVKQPGVYALEPESRVYEAVMAAGGFTEEADEDYVNQAQPISDGVKLQIPTREEVATGSVESTAAGITGGSVESTAAGITGGGNVPATAEPEILQDGRIDINTATEAQLCGIPGIGATRAAAIAAYRQEHGRFDRIEDIMKVNGIKEGTFEKIKDAIKVD